MKLSAASILQLVHPILCILWNMWVRCWVKLRSVFIAFPFFIEHWVRAWRVSFITSKGSTLSPHLISRCADFYRLNHLDATKSDVWFITKDKRQYPSYNNFLQKIFWYPSGNFWPHFMITEFLIPNHTLGSQMWFITMRLSHQNAHMCLSRCPVCIWSVLKLPCVPL